MQKKIIFLLICYSSSSALFALDYTGTQKLMEDYQYTLKSSCDSTQCSYTCIPKKSKGLTCIREDGKIMSESSFIKMLKS
jgi:hypothetical protein